MLTRVPNPISLQSLDVLVVLTLKIERSPRRSSLPPCRQCHQHRCHPPGSSELPNLNHNTTTADRRARPRSRSTAVGTLI
ncbi:hypothetical protein GLYMA_17G122600v4 [Glycine max]|uniref:Uncharacterized protein n=1 Tax=Glycine max TaxID=3847 RepID=K7MLB5_SOYBN|nr:hypothetical protein JHK87_047001 [Glycine soja]KAG4943129.1 hypothetical protein JHK85_047775 [Glycine max]KAH1118132.1 hypothetical protein GYH30_047056 [Glycine max]KRH03828.1 hypothetical protein GLYMA_17G122600v4 [Glycine max]